MAQDSKPEVVYPTARIEYWPSTGTPQAYVLLAFAPIPRQLSLRGRPPLEPNGLNLLVTLDENVTEDPHSVVEKPKRLRGSSTQWPSSRFTLGK